MKVSLNWIRYYRDLYRWSADPAPDGVEVLVEKIGAQLGAVEEVISLGEKYQGILIVKVVSCVKHPNADKLSLCLVDDGGADKKVKRGDNGLIQVVCGAPNVKAGQLAVWIPPGATVPSTYGKEPFVIEARPIRNKTSHGMLASPKELALGDSHEGILILEEGKPGDDFARTVGLDDHVIDIENKMFTHRPDLFGQMGVARELAGIQGQVFKSPAWYREAATIPTDGRSNGLKLAVKNQIPELVPRFCAVALKDIKIGSSPVWLQAQLSAVGIRPINNIVDLTNYYMMLTAQPLHAYDYDKVKTGILGARLSKKGEKLNLLNGKQITLNEGSMVITDGAKPIGLAGVMGGADTEVDENTKNIILECANFDMNETRKSAMRYGLFTDAATRFTKNQSPRQNMAVMTKAVEDIKRVAGGRVASKVVDEKPAFKITQPVEVKAEFINSRLGTTLAAGEIKKLLENVEFEVKVSGDDLTVTAPFWRTDIEIPEDIVEETSRMHGYDKLPVVLPKRDLTPAAKNVPLEFKARLRDIMVKAGANDVLTYSFVNERLLNEAGQDPAEAYKIANAVSPDLQYYRLDLLPSLLEKVHPNVKNGLDAFTIFELGKGHLKNLLDEEVLPREAEFFAAVMVDSRDKGAAYYNARTYVDYVFQKLNIIGATFTALPETKLKMKSSIFNCYEPSRAAVIWHEERALGLIGEPSQRLRAGLKLPPNTSMFEFDIPNLYEASAPEIYHPLNRYPSISQDICLKMGSGITYQEADGFLWQTLQELSAARGYSGEMEVLDIFQKKNEKPSKQITWRITFYHPERTLTTEEANKLLDELALAAKKQLNAERI